jgi:hypothetical protein
MGDPVTISLGLYELAMLLAGSIVTLWFQSQQGRKATEEAAREVAEQLDRIKEKLEKREQEPPEKGFPVPPLLPPKPEPKARCESKEEEKEREPQVDCKRDQLKMDKEKGGFDHERGTRWKKDVTKEIWEEDSGRIVDDKGNPVVNRKLIYVKLPDGTFRFSPDRDPKTGRRLPHSMLGKGKSVIGAGECEVDDKGRITEVNNMSGHYQPREKNLGATKKNMESRGLAIKNQTRWWLKDESMPGRWTQRLIDLDSD